MDAQNPHCLPEPEEQIEAIRAMLSTGHRAIRLEPHTFWLWGLVATACLLGERTLFTPSRFPIHWQLATFQVLSIAICIGFGFALDFHLSKRVKRERDESYPFIQRQMGKLTLLLVSLGLLMTLGGWHHSWYTLVFAFWLADLGIILFVHSLFSEPFLGWAGVSLIGLSVAAVGLAVPFDGTRFLLLAACGLGLPSLGLLLRPLGRWGTGARLACLVAWTSAISGAAYIGFQMSLPTRVASYSLEDTTHLSWVAPGSSEPGSHAAWRQGTKW